MTALPSRVRAGYGVAELGINGVEVLIRVGLLIFYTDVVGLAPALAGYAVALGVLWDAVTDPLMGRISDRTAGRFGRRRPYIAAGALLLAIAIVVLFSPPTVDSQSAKFVVLLASYIFANTAMTVIAVPHSALAGDMSSDSHERTRLFGWRLVFANLGLVLGTALPGVLLASMASPDSMAARARADQLTAMVLAAVTVAAAAITLRATRGRDSQAPVSRSAKSSRFVPALASVVRNRSFLSLFAAYLIANIGLNINSSTALYYYRYRLLLEEHETRLIIAVFMAVFCVAIPGWIALSARFGKKRPLIAGAAALGAMNCVVYLLFPPGNAYWPLLASVIGGLAIGAVVLLDAMLADVVDLDRLKRREARFGLYFGFWKMGAKASRAVAIAIAGNLLAWIGFEPNVSQSAGASLGLALIFGPGVGVFFLAAAAVLVVHKLDETRHARIRRLLERRAARAEHRAGGRRAVAVG